MKKEIILFALFSICLGITASGQQNNSKEDPNFLEFQLDDLKAKQQENGRPWLPFLQGKNVLTGLYHLKAGAEDRQQPHDTDEVYYVVSGKAKFKAGDQITDAGPGSILFVKAEIPHRFFDIEEDLVVLVFFDQ